MSPQSLLSPHRWQRVEAGAVTGSGRASSDSSLQALEGEAETTNSQHYKSHDHAITVELWQDMRHRGEATWGHPWVPASILKAGPAPAGPLEPALHPPTCTGKHAPLC